MAALNLAPSSPSGGASPMARPSAKASSIAAWILLPDWAWSAPRCLAHASRGSAERRLIASRRGACRPSGLKPDACNRSNTSLTVEVLYVLYAVVMCSPILLVPSSKFQVRHSTWNLEPGTWNFKSFEEAQPVADLLEAGLEGQIMGGRVFARGCQLDASHAG